MNRVAIKVIDTDFNLLDVIEDFHNPFFERKWYDVGEFQIDVENLNHIGTLKIDNIVFIEPAEPYIIEAVEIDIDEETMLVKGQTAQSDF